MEHDPLTDIHELVLKANEKELDDERFSAEELKVTNGSRMTRRGLKKRWCKFTPTLETGPKSL